MQAVEAYSHHAITGDRLHGAESKAIAMFVKPTDQVLDIGCGTGRVTRALARTGATVSACDLDTKAMEIFKQSEGSQKVETIFADVRNLPYESEQFDVVLFPFNGLDMLQPLRERFVAISEMERVLKPGGYLILSSHNPVGEMLSPRGLRHFRNMRYRISKVLSGRMMETYGVDPLGVAVYHGTPRRVIEEIESHTELRILFCWNRTGSINSILLTTLFSAWPSYVFQRK